MQPRGWRIGVLAGMAWFVLVGCSTDPLGRLAVSGTVTYKGKPVNQGSIEFIPQPGGKTHSGATLQNGRYSIPADRGLAPGTYTVVISSITGGAAVNPNAPPGEPIRGAKELLPAKYNTNSTLTKEVSKANTTIDFNLD